MQTEIGNSLTCPYEENGPPFQKAPSSERAATSRTPSTELRSRQGSFEFDAIQTMAKHFVSGNRTRYVDDGYDLDLSYITERVIAMAFPGEDLVGAFSAVIRNSLRRVSYVFSRKYLYIR
jgi:hypothetical protein